MIRRYPPNRMLSILVVLLAMAAYFSFDLYSREQSQSSRLHNDKRGHSISQQIGTAPQTQNNLNSSLNAEVQGGRPEDKIISQGAVLIIKKIYTLCGHTEKINMDMPADLVNLTEYQLKIAYPSYKIEKFSSSEVILSRSVRTKCKNHYILKEKDGLVAVYYQQPIGDISLKEVTPLSVNSLPQKEKERLKTGIKVESQQELAQMLEDLGS